MPLIIYEDHIDKDTMRDDILAEIHDKIDKMSIKEVIFLRNLIFKDERNEIILKETNTELLKN